MTMRFELTIVCDNEAELTEAHRRITGSSVIVPAAAPAEVPKKAKKVAEPVAEDKDEPEVELPPSKAKKESKQESLKVLKPVEEAKKKAKAPITEDDVRVMADRVRTAFGVTSDDDTTELAAAKEFYLGKKTDLIGKSKLSEIAANQEAAAKWMSACELKITELEAAKSNDEPEEDDDC